MRSGKVVALSALMTLASLQTANASGFSWNGSTICGGNLFATCAAVTVSTSFNASTGRTTVVMSVTNLAGSNGTYAGTVFTQIGLWNLPTRNPGAAYVDGSLTVLNQQGTNVTSAWQLGTPGLSGGGIQPGVFGVDPTNGINGGMLPGDAYTFTFELTGLPSDFDLNTTGVALHGQGGFDGCSTKLVIDGAGTPNEGPYDPACLPPTTTIPEPVTMTLLATGLAGMGGAGIIRRRRNRNEIS